MDFSQLHKYMRLYAKEDSIRVDQRCAAPRGLPKGHYK